TVPATTTAPSGRKASLKTPSLPPAVETVMDQMMTYGMPDRALKPEEELAYQQLKKQGVDVSVAATVAARGQADTGRMIMPLIQRARDLIAQGADIGPLAGRWSELEQKIGTLSGPTKELAGTLVSIYSMSGSLHKWRAIQVADKFKDAYGDI